jgi:hypothetical protein
MGMVVMAADAATCNRGGARGSAGDHVGELLTVGTEGTASLFGASPPSHQVAAATAVAAVMSHMRWDIQYGQFCW